MTDSTIAHVCAPPGHQPTSPTPPAARDPLDLECRTRAVRHCLWVAIYLIQELDLPDLEHHLTILLQQLDRRLAEMDRP